MKCEVKNREIKFRAWHKTRKKMITPVWVFGEYYQFDLEFKNQWVCGIGSKDITLSQFTGLKDCDNKDIYEGDIIQSMYLFNHENRIVLYVMEYIEGGRLVAKEIKRNKDGGYLTFSRNNLTGHDYNSFKVINNIYENPEILR